MNCTFRKGRTFDLFPQLPPEIRLLVWRLARNADQPRHFQIIFTQEPIYLPPEIRSDARIPELVKLPDRLVWEYRVFTTPADRLVPYQPANSEDWQEFFRNNPDEIYIKDGRADRTVRFKGSRDRVELATDSLIALHYYYTNPNLDARGNGRLTRQTQLKGFNLIQHLGVPDRLFHSVGLDFLRRKVMTAIRPPITQRPSIIIRVLAVNIIHGQINSLRFRLMTSWNYSPTQAASIQALMLAELPDSKRRVFAFFRRMPGT